MVVGLLTDDRHRHHPTPPYLPTYPYLPMTYLPPNRLERLDALSFADTERGDRAAIRTVARYMAPYGVAGDVTDVDSPDPDDYYGRHAPDVKYVEVHDTYGATLLRDDGGHARWYVGCWADAYEAAEQAYADDTGAWRCGACGTWCDASEGKGPDPHGHHTTVGPCCGATDHVDDDKALDEAAAALWTAAYARAVAALPLAHPLRVLPDDDDVPEVPDGIREAVADAVGPTWSATDAANTPKAGTHKDAYDVGAAVAVAVGPAVQVDIDGLADVDPYAHPFDLDRALRGLTTTVTTPAR